MKLKYFAWLRSKTGVASEDVTPPADVATVGALVDWLARRGPGYADAFRERGAVRAAVNHEYVGFEDPVSDADEVAFFPPVTGG